MIIEVGQVWRTHPRKKVNYNNSTTITTGYWIDLFADQKFLVIGYIPYSEFCWEIRFLFTVYSDIHHCFNDDDFIHCDLLEG